jgi:dihydroxyacetone kinase-like protein
MPAHIKKGGMTGMDALSVVETKRMFVFVAGKMIENQDLLSQADRAIGDGDHGVGMARGFEAVQQKLDSNFGSLGELFNAIGMILLTSIGGAAGAIFGTLFRGGAKNMGELQSFDSAALALFLRGGLEAVVERGKARPGDKTMLDVLEPAARHAAGLADRSLEVALQALAPLAEQGVENTRQMIATVGKAKTLGERSLGHPDPGAISMCLILKFMAEYVSNENC